MCYQQSHREKVQRLLRLPNRTALLPFHTPPARLPRASHQELEPPSFNSGRPQARSSARGPAFPTTPEIGRNDVHLCASQVNLEAVKRQPHMKDGDH